MSGNDIHRLVCKRSSYDLERKLTDWSSRYDLHIATRLSDKGLQSLEFAAPYRFHVSIPIKVPGFGRATDTHRPYLEKIGLRSARELNAVSRMRGLPQHDLTVVNPGSCHSLGYLVTESSETRENSMSALRCCHRLQLLLDERVRTSEETNLVDGGPYIESFVDLRHHRIRRARSLQRAGR
jgi:hypothetical protein